MLSAALHLCLLEPLQANHQEIKDVPPVRSHRESCMSIKVIEVRVKLNVEVLASLEVAKVAVAL